MKNFIQEHYCEPHKICGNNGQAENHKVDDDFKDQFVPKTEGSVSNIITEQLLLIRLVVELLIKVVA